MPVTLEIPIGGPGLDRDGGAGSGRGEANFFFRVRVRSPAVGGAARRDCLGRRRRREEEVGREAREEDDDDIRGHPSVRKKTLYLGTEIIGLYRSVELGLKAKKDPIIQWAAAEAHS